MRTKEEILMEMDSEFARHPELSDLNNNNSAVSIWQLLKNLWVTLVQTLESRWDNLVAETDAKIVAARTGTKLWYVRQALGFQLGDALDVINGVAGYVVVDDTKRIIKQATATEDLNTGRIMLRVAKAFSPTELVPLSESELAAAKEYIHQIKYAGVPVDVVSIPADEVRIVARCKVDPQLVTTQGTDVANPDRYIVLDAINTYLRSIPYNSEISWTGLTDHLQATPGIRDFVITESAIRRPGTTAWIAAGSVTQSPAGHAVLHADSAITYIS